MRPVNLRCLKGKGRWGGRRGGEAEKQPNESEGREGCRAEEDERGWWDEESNSDTTSFSPLPSTHMCVDAFVRRTPPHVEAVKPIVRALHGFKPGLRRQWGKRAREDVF